MKITSIKGVAQLDNIKCFKPVGKIFIKSYYEGLKSLGTFDPLIRVRLVDGRNGSSDELVPEMPLSVLSEIASKYEGFQRREGYNPGTGKPVGFNLSTILLGAIVGHGVGENCAAIDLSNDKYLDIDLRNLDPLMTYEVWGMENHVISPYVRTYKKFYLSAGELEKTFHVEGNEVFVYPISHVKELQMYAKNGTSPVYRKEELILDEDGRNDLVSVELGENNQCIGTVIENRPGYVYIPIRFGYSEWGVMDVTSYNRFDFRREDGATSIMFLMIDTVPTLPTVVANS